MITQELKSPKNVDNPLRASEEVIRRSVLDHENFITSELKKSGDIDVEKRTVTFSWGSETAVDRGPFVEKIDFRNGKIDLRAMNLGGHLLDNHDISKRLGRVEKIWIDKDEGRGFATVKFSANPGPSEVFRDIVDGIASNISFRYRINAMKFDKTENDVDHYIVNDIIVLELSVVSIPADASIGIGRSGELNMNRKEFEKIIVSSAKGETHDEQERGSPMSNENNVVSIEQTRSGGKNEAAEILSLGEKHGFRDLASEFIRNSRSSQEFQAALLEALGKKSMEKPLPQANVREEFNSKIGLTRSDAENYRYSNAILASATGNWKGAELEREISEETAKNYGIKKRDNGIYIPPEVSMIAPQFGQRDIMGAMSDLSGKKLIQEEVRVSSFIEMLRSKLILDKLGGGITILEGLTDKLAIPRQSGMNIAGWLKEGDEAHSTPPKIEQVQMEPRRVATFTDYSRKLLVQSHLSIENLVRSDLAYALGLSILYGALLGDGKDESPTGILNNAKIIPIPNPTAADGVYKNIVDMESSICSANADIASMAYLATPTVRGWLKKHREFKDFSDKIWTTGPDGEGRVNGHQAEVSTIFNYNKDTGANPASPAPTSFPNDGVIICGCWSQMILGLWGPIFLQTNPYIHSSHGTIRVDIEQLADINVRHPESFNYIKNILLDPATDKWPKDV